MAIQVDETGAGRDTLLEEWPYSPLFHDFATFLGIPTLKDPKGTYWRGDKKTADKIEEIFAWGKRASGSKDPVDVKLAVKALIRHLGVTRKGKELVEHLWGYLRLSHEQERITKEMKLYEERKEVKETHVEEPTQG